MPFLPYCATTDVAAQVAIVQGYNTNTYQTLETINANQALLNRHASPYTGFDASVTFQATTRLNDTHSLRLQARGQYYTPFDNSYQPPDGALVASWGSRFTLSRRSAINIVSAASLTTLNGSRLSDATVFVVDPSTSRQTFWISSTDATHTYELAPTWRNIFGVGVLFGGSINAPPIRNLTGDVIQHQGLDYVRTYAEERVAKDFTERTTGDVGLRVVQNVSLFLADLTVNPPRNIGPVKSTTLLATVGHTYRWTPDLMTVVRGGGALAPPPPQDPDRRAIVSPVFSGELFYVRERWQLIGTASYTFGTLNPRLGEGPTMGGGVTILGTPYSIGNWRNLAIVVNGQARYSELLTGVGTSTKLGVIAASVEARYALSTWLGVVGGYDVRYAFFDGPTYVPPLLRQLVYVGLSGYWSTDKNIPAITNVTVPSRPGG